MAPAPPAALGNQVKALFSSRDKAVPSQRRCAEVNREIDVEYIDAMARLLDGVGGNWPLCSALGRAVSYNFVVTETFTGSCAAIGHLSRLE